MNKRFVASTELCQDGSLPGDLHDFLRSKVGLRPTRQRIAIASAAAQGSEPAGHR